jgi:hypothetical protein
MTPIQQAYNLIVEISAKNVNDHKRQVREILLSLGAKETPVKKDKKCKA